MQPPDPRDAWDMERKRQKKGPSEYRAARAWERKRQKEEGLYACATCGEAVRHYGQRCDRCKASIEEDRLNRGD